VVLLQLIFDKGETMTINETKFAALVRRAESLRQRHLNKAFASVGNGLALESHHDANRLYGPWGRELNEVNQHITVPPEEIAAAAKAYENAGRTLVRKLHWPDDSISVHPQGSASTQTLIRSPDASKFDIDAVCAVDISRLEGYDPMSFFNKIGYALEDLEAEAKKRCWKLPCSNERFYLEFTPSVPLEKVSQSEMKSFGSLLPPYPEYLPTSLAVVDTPTKSWKTSNPKGITQWVDDTSKRQLIRYLSLEERVVKATNVEPVVDQEVEMSDVLRVAIRLFKRHRDMQVHRNNILNEYKPISIILVTLLTAAYAGFADSGRRFKHAVELLMELAELLPGMVEQRNGMYWVENPTVPGENFAERWNGDGGKRSEAFKTWCQCLAADMQIILLARESAAIRGKVRAIFGCEFSSTSPNGGNGGVRPAHLAPRPVPKTSGLA
jgi:hypothetical protein